jgi:hypothetical protein
MRKTLIRLQIALALVASAAVASAGSFSSAGGSGPCGSGVHCIGGLCACVVCPNGEVYYSTCPWPIAN